MHAALFRLDLDSSATPAERASSGRSLAAALSVLRGFVAFIAIEADDGHAAGLCICLDAEALGEARQLAASWQRERGGQVKGASDCANEPIFTGEVIVQRGF